MEKIDHPGDPRRIPLPFERAVQNPFQPESQQEIPMTLPVIKISIVRNEVGQIGLTTNQLSILDRRVRDCSFRQPLDRLCLFDRRRTGGAVAVLYYYENEFRQRFEPEQTGPGRGPSHRALKDGREIVAFLVYHPLTS